jgi:replicative DNA helicase
MITETKKIGVSRVPPHHSEAEQSVLGAIMLEPKSLDLVSDILHPEDFYERRHETIYTAMLELYSKQEPIDSLSVANKLKENKVLKESGGNAYLTDLVNSVPTASNVKHYAEIVRKKKILRDLIESSGHIADLGFNEKDDVEELLDDAEKRIFSIARHSIKQKFQGVKELFTDAWDRLDKLHKSTDELRGITTGFGELDNKLAGLQNADLIILAARPSMGKTALALDIARNAAKNGTPVGIFSLEMSAQQIVDRLLAAEAMVDAWKMRTGKGLNDDDFGRISDALNTLSQAPIFIDDEASKNILQMRAMARRLQAEHGLGLLIVDYLQLMAPRTSSDNMVQQMTEISRSLKGLAKELNVPVLALSQLSRAVESRQDKRPKLHDLRDSGSIEQDADVVMFIYREKEIQDEVPDFVETELLIEKHRNGPTGRVMLHFNPNKVSFRSVDSRSDFGSL